MIKSASEVFVIDDDPGIAEVLHRLLKSVNIKHRIYTNAEDFLSDYRQEKGCMILDIRLQGMSGMVLQERMQQQKINLPIIFLTGHGNVDMAVKAMKSGAHDFITKPFNNQDLLDKIYLAISSGDNKAALARESHAVKVKIEQLTKREYELLELIIDGKQTKEIARDLDISINTAQIHRSNLMKKMGAKNLGTLINMVLKSRNAI